jgi:invasion protein IalB
MLKKLPNLNFSLRGFLIGLATLCVGLVLGWTLRGALLSPANQATSARYEDWRVECAPRDQDPGGCEMFEVIVDTNTRAPVARIAFANLDGAFTLATTLPFDVLLEPGVGLAFGSDQIKVYQFRTCNQSGCLVTIPIDDKLEASLQKSDKGRLVYAGLDQKPVGFDFSLKGYAAARRALESGDAKRQSLWWRLWS